MRASLPIPGSLESFRLVVDFQLEVLEDSIRYAIDLLIKYAKEPPASVCRFIYHTL